MSDKPSLLKIYLQLMKLRVVILLQVTAISAIVAHDLMTRSGALSGDRTWLDTLQACLITILGGTLAAGGSNARRQAHRYASFLSRSARNDVCR